MAPFSPFTYTICSPQEIGKQTEQLFRFTFVLEVALIDNVGSNRAVEETEGRGEGEKEKHNFKWLVLYYWAQFESESHEVFEIRRRERARERYLFK